MQIPSAPANKGWREGLEFTDKDDESGVFLVSFSILIFNGMGYYW